MTTRRAACALAVLAALLGRPAAAAPAKGEIQVYVPCGMILPFNRVKQEFEKRTGTRVKITYDNGYMLVKRIRDKGERPDIVVTPGELEIRKLVESGQVAKDSAVTIGSFKLILVASARAKVRSLDDLAKPQVKRFILADPDSNSLGYYAKSALMKLGLWDKMKGKVMTHWHAQETVDYVCTGRVDAGLFYASCPFESAPEKVVSQTYRVICDVPKDAYPPVRVQAAALPAGKNRAGAEEFLRYLQSPGAQKKLSELGIPNFGKPAVSPKGKGE